MDETTTNKSDLKLVNLSRLSEWATAWIIQPCQWVMFVVHPGLFNESFLSGEEDDVKVDLTFTLAHALKQIAFIGWCGKLVSPNQIEGFQSKATDAAQKLIDLVGEGRVIPTVILDDLFHEMLSWCEVEKAETRLSLRKKWDRFASGAKWQQIDEEWKTTFTTDEENQQEITRLNPPPVSSLPLSAATTPIHAPPPRDERQRHIMDTAW